MYSYLTNYIGCYIIYIYIYEIITQLSKLISMDKIRMSKSAEKCIELPVFDIFQPLNPSSLSSLSQACKEFGFFHITNHGVSKELYHKLYSLSTHLFNLPLQSKLKAGPLSSIKTYTPRFIASPFFESLRVSGPDFFSSAQSSALHLLNQNNSEFR